MLYVIFWQYFVLSFSDGEASKMKPPGENQAAAPSQQRPPSPLGPPPALVAQQAGAGTQSSRNISPAVAAALLQLISQQDAEASTLQQLKQPPAVDAPAQGQPPPTWVADSPLKSSEAPAGLVTTTVGQFPKDQDLRFSHGSTHSPSIPFWGRPVCVGNGHSSWQGTKEKAQNVIHWIGNIKNAGSKRKWMSLSLRSWSQTSVPAEQAVLLERRLGPGVN